MFISRKNRFYISRNLFASGFLVVFAIIYEFFSHNVVSYYMVGAFLIPLSGSVPYILAPVLRKGVKLKTTACEMWQLGLYTLSLGSVMKGVIEIYGTTNRLTQVYLPLALVFIAAACVCQGLPGNATVKRVRQTRER